MPPPPTMTGAFARGHPGGPERGDLGICENVYGLREEKRDPRRPFDPMG
jgi:hypothetical protein